MIFASVPLRQPESITNENSENPSPQPSDPYSDGRKLRDILDTAYDAFVAIDAASVVTDWNRQAEATFGWTRAEALGRPLAALILPARFRAAHESGIAHFFATGVGPVLGRRIELPAVHKSGVEIPIELTVSAIKREDGTTFAAFLHDISDRRRAERNMAVQLGVTRITAELSSVEVALERTLHLLCRDLGWAFGAIWTVEGDTLHCVQAWHDGSEELLAFEKTSRSARFGKGGTLPGRVWASGAPSWIAAFQDDTSLPRASAAASAGLFSAAAFPIWNSDEFVGVIELFSAQVEEPDEALLAMMADVGARLGMFVHRSKAEAQVRLTDERERLLAEMEFRTVFDLTATGAAQIEAHSRRFLRVNPKFCEMLGYAASELTGLSLVDVTHADDRAEVGRSLRDLVEGRCQNLTQEHRFLRKDGTSGWAILSATMVRDAARGAHRVITIHQDVTERRLGEERQRFLAEAASVLGSLDYQTNLTNLTHLVVPGLADWCAIDVVDETGKLKRLAIAHVDPAKVHWARELHERYPAHQDATFGLPQVIRTGRPELYAEISDELLQASAVDAEHLEIMRAIGLRSGMIVPLAFRDRVLGALSMVSDESGRRFTPSDLEFAIELGRRAGMAIENARLYRESVATNRMKDEFLATLSHELRTPLNSIVGWTELIRNKEIEPEEVDEAIEVIFRNAHSQVQLITDLLDVSRIITGKLHIDPVSVDVWTVVTEAVSSVKLAAKAKGLTLVQDGEAFALTIEGDRDRLRQVVWNLLTNAIRFTPRGGVVTVRARRLDAQVEIAVIDDGEGIDPGFLPHVFERFRQEDSSVTRRHGGLGLGLAIVRHIVELHGGTVAAASAGHGKGASFVVTLPHWCTPLAEPPPLAPTAKHLAPAAIEAFTGLQILVVDDDRDSRLMLRRILQNQGASVLEAASAEAALELLHAHHFDLMVSDIGMPDMDGYELIRRIRADPSPAVAQVAAIALTAYARDEERRAALRAGFQEHVPKPLKSEVLIEKIRALAAAARR